MPEAVRGLGQSKPVDSRMEAIRRYHEKERQRRDRLYGRTSEASAQSRRFSMANKQSALDNHSKRLSDARYQRAVNAGQITLPRGTAKVVSIARGELTHFLAHAAALGVGPWYRNFTPEAYADLKKWVTSSNKERAELAEDRKEKLTVLVDIQLMNQINNKKLKVNEATRIAASKQVANQFGLNALKEQDGQLVLEDKIQDNVRDIIRGTAQKRIHKSQVAKEIANRRQKRQEKKWEDARRLSEASESVRSGWSSRRGSGSSRSSLGSRGSDAFSAMSTMSAISFFQDRGHDFADFDEVRPELSTRQSEVPDTARTRPESASVPNSVESEPTKTTKESEKQDKSPVRDEQPNTTTFDTRRQSGGIDNMSAFTRSKPGGEEMVRYSPPRPKTATDRGVGNYQFEQAANVQKPLMGKANTKKHDRMSFVPSVETPINRTSVEASRPPRKSVAPRTIPAGPSVPPKVTPKAPVQTGKPPADSGDSRESLERSPVSRPSGAPKQITRIPVRVSRPSVAASNPRVSLAPSRPARPSIAPKQTTGVAARLSRPSVGPSNPRVSLAPSRPSRPSIAPKQTTGVAARLSRPSVGPSNPRASLALSRPARPSIAPKQTTGVAARVSRPSVGPNNPRASLAPSRLSRPSIAPTPSVDDPKNRLSVASSVASSKIPTFITAFDEESTRHSSIGVRSEVESTTKEALLRQERKYPEAFDTLVEKRQEKIDKWVEKHSQPKIAGLIQGLPLPEKKKERRVVHTNPPEIRKGDQRRMDVIRQHHEENIRSMTEHIQGQLAILKNRYLRMPESKRRELPVDQKPFVIRPETLPIVAERAITKYPGPRRPDIFEIREICRQIRQ